MSQLSASLINCLFPDETPCFGSGPRSWVSEGGEKWRRAAAGVETERCPNKVLKEFREAYNIKILATPLKEVQNIDRSAFLKLLELELFLLNLTPLQD